VSEPTSDDWALADPDDDIDRLIVAMQAAELARDVWWGLKRRVDELKRTERFEDPAMVKATMGLAASHRKTYDTAREVLAECLRRTG